MKPLTSSDDSMNINCYDSVEASMLIMIILEDLALHFHFLFPVNFKNIRKTLTIFRGNEPLESSQGWPSRLILYGISLGAITFQGSRAVCSHV